MSDQKQDRLHELLFGDPTRELVDFKVFPGTNPNATEQEVRDEAARMVEAGLPDPTSRPPDSDLQQMSAEELLRSG